MRDSHDPSTPTDDGLTAGSAPGPISVKGQRTTGWVLFLAGIVGLLGAFSLAYEKFLVLDDPDHSISCDINPVLSCGSVMATPQASLFGFPNPLIGLMAFPFVIFTGVLFASRVRLPRFVTLLFNLGTLGGMVFIGWLTVQSIFVIEVLCPYCMVVWAATIPTFWFATVYSLRSGALPVGRNWRAAVDDVLKFHWVGLALLYLIPVALILMVFGDRLFA
ncbi:vitamin K epoxide reductase family protein [Haloglycomyces albus]|uniref:vitamin K epoxide reductase family protein n=1 Tax=Haloglycomyces albus TaxID=526067 RepID=UPI0004B3EBD6|nr:vitamin K epoxide reductase family protein [Haloglycomyces albus]